MAYTFNTGNPVGPNGSTDARDLVDNAQVADLLINSTELTAPDRLGVQRRTWAGINHSVAGYTPRGPWVTGTDYLVNELWEYDGSWYQVLSDYTSGATAAADITGGNVALFQTKDFVRQIKSVAEAKALTALADGQAVYLSAGGRSGPFSYELGDYTTEVAADTLSGVYIPLDSDPTGAAGCLVRQEYPLIYGGFFGAKSDASGSGTGTDSSAAIELAASISEVPVSLDGGSYRADSVTLESTTGIDGGSGCLNTRIYTANGITFNNSFSTLRGLNIDTELSESYGVNIPDDGYNNFANQVVDSRCRGKNGIDSAGVETKVRSYYGVGTGFESSGTGIKSTNWDMSLTNVLLQDYGTGVYSENGVQASDLHIVRSKTAINLQQQGHPSQFSNTYIDTPKRRGLALFDQSYVTMTSTYVLNVGDPSYSSEATGFYFDSNSKYNNLLGVHFQQNTDSDWYAAFTFESLSVDNLLLGLSGAYKMPSIQRDRLRNQTVIGCHGEWARFNNVSRKCRARAVSVGAGLTQVVDFILDYIHPTISNDTVLFIGNYSSRTTGGKSAVGRLVVPVQFDDFGSSPVVEKITGHADNEWSITSVSLSGSTLSITFKNDGPETASLSAEVERSVDATGITF